MVGNLAFLCIFLRDSTCTREILQVGNSNLPSLMVVSRRNKQLRVHFLNDTNRLIAKQTARTSSRILLANESLSERIWMIRSRNFAPQVRTCNVSLSTLRLISTR